MGAVLECRCPSHTLAVSSWIGAILIPPSPSWSARSIRVAMMVSLNSWFLEFRTACMKLGRCSPGRPVNSKSIASSGSLSVSGCVKRVSHEKQTKPGSKTYIEEIHARYRGEVDHCEDNVAPVVDVRDHTASCQLFLPAQREGRRTYGGVIWTTTKVNSHWDTTASAPPRSRSFSGRISLG